MEILLSVLKMIPIIIIIVIIIMVVIILFVQLLITHFMVSLYLSDVEKEFNQ